MFWNFHVSNSNFVWELHLVFNRLSLVTLVTRNLGALRDFVSYQYPNHHKLNINNLEPLDFFFHVILASFMSVNRLSKIEKQTKPKARVRVGALIWAYWNCRNDTVFNKVETPHLFIGYLYDYLLVLEVVLPAIGNVANTYNSGCNYLETVARVHLQPCWLVAFLEEFKML
jgi:hypothetical protein